MRTQEDRTGHLRPDTTKSPLRRYCALTIEIPQFFLLLIVLLFTAEAGHAQSTANVHGSVVDVAGAPAANATVMLTCEAKPELSAHTITSSDGAFSLRGLAACRYHVSAQRKQSFSAPVELTVSESSAPDRELRLTLAAESVPGADTAARPKFAASGIRGLIDPGGYSAPASAAAASGLLTGMAEVNRERSAGKGCSNRALSELTDAHQRDPHDVAATLNLAEALIDDQHFEQARALLLTLTEGRSSDVRTLHLLARVDEGTGAFDAAAVQYHRLAAVEPTVENAFAEGYELILMGQLENAAVVYRRSLAIYPNSTSLMIGAGTTAFLQQHKAKATALFLQAAVTDPKDPRPYPFLAAASSVSLEDGDKVIAAMQQHVAVAPEDASGHFALAVQLLHMPEDAATAARAETELRQAVRIDPTLAEAHYQLAIVLARRGVNEEVLRELQLTVALDPAHREAHYRLALALRKAGQPEAAAVEMQRFQKARVEDAAAGSDLRRYLSVMKQPGGIDSCNLK